MSPADQKQRESLPMPSCEPTPKSDSNSCAHCGRSISFLRKFEEQKRCQEDSELESGKNEAQLLFCCAGCEQVFKFVQSGHLNKYYELLNSLSNFGPTQKDSEIAPMKKSYDSNLKQLFSKGNNEFVFFVPSLRCAACIWLIEKCLSELKHVEQVRVNLIEKTVTIHAASDLFSISETCQLLLQMGYKPLPPQISDWNDNQKGLSRKTAQDLAISGTLFANIMLLAIAIYFGDFWGIDPKMKQFFNILMFFLGSMSLLFPGATFIKSSWNSIKIRKLHIDLPISFALLVTYITSTIGMIQKSSLIYFDSLSGLIFLLLSARAINEFLIVRAHRLSQYATSLLPESSFQAKPGDDIWVAIGEHFPADGVIKEGQTEVNESAITGESRLQIKTLGDAIYAGTQNVTKPVLLHALRCGADSFVGKLITLVQNAGQQKSQFQIISERILPYFITFTLFSAVFSSAIWLFIDASKAPAVLATVLIVACPCAIALSVPLTLAFAMNSTWKNGFVIKNPQALERLCQIKTLMIDKTGTLTTGHFTVDTSHFTDDLIQQNLQLLGAAWCLVSRSKHPVSKSLQEFLEQHPHVMARARIFNAQNIECVEVLGMGMQGTFPQLGEVFVGKPATNLNSENSFQKNFLSTNVLLKCQRNEIILELQDTLKPGAIDFLNHLICENFEIHIATGDNKVSSDCFIQNLKQKGVQTEKLFMHSNFKPQQKLDLMNELQHKSNQIIMIGDGVNDAPALAKADVGVAMGGGIDLALNAADILFLNPNLLSFKNLVTFSKHTLVTLRIVVTLSIFYNLMAVSLACFGILHPLIAALIMPLSSLSTGLIVYLRKGDSIWKSCTGSFHSHF